MHIISFFKKVKVCVSIGRILKQTSRPQKKKKEKSAFYFALLRCTWWLGRGRKNFGMYIYREVKAEGLTATSPVASCLPCQTCWLLNGWLELLFGQLHCFCWTSVLRNTDTTAGVGRKGERNNLAELQYPSIIKYREDPVLLAKSYSVCNQLIFSVPPSFPSEVSVFWTWHFERDPWYPCFAPLILHL